MHPVCVLVVQIRVRRSEQGQQGRLTIRLMDDDSVLSEIEGDFTAPPPPVPGDVRINNLMRLVALQFPHEGSYAFHVLLNGSEVAEVPLTVVQQAPSP